MRKVICILLIGICLFGCSDSNVKNKDIENNSTVQNEEIEYEEELNKYKSYQSGTYEVGKDIDAGEYCLFVKKLSNMNDSFSVRREEYVTGEDSIISEYNFLNYYITLKEGEYIEFDGALLFSVKDMPVLDKNLIFGMLKVRKDIEEGKYKVIPIEESKRAYDGSVHYRVMEPINGEERNEIITIAIDFTIDKKNIVKIEPIY